MTTITPAPLPPLCKGAFTSAHVVRWCAAQQNWHKIHFDRDYAQQHAGLPERVINGALKQHLLVQFLENAFPGGWIAQLDFRFLGPDLVGHSLEVRGVIIALTPAEGGGEVARVSLEIHNAERGSATTTGTALLHIHPDGPRKAQAAWASRSERDQIDNIGEGQELARRYQLELGCTLERLQSDYAIDPSRLRLFADAIGDLDSRYFDTAEAVRQGYPAVVAPPLFPIHALELRPGSRPLSTDPQAWGREGVSELGRSVGDRLRLPGEKMLNGGSLVRIHSLAVAGDTVVAESRLMALVWRPYAGRGPLLSIQTFNTYATTTGRPLLDERVSILYQGITL